MSILIVHPEGSAQVVSSSTHWSKGNVDRDLVGFAVLGALLGGFGGGEMAAPLPERALRLIFATWLAGRIFLMRLLSFCVHTAFFLHFFFIFSIFWIFLLHDLPDVCKFGMGKGRKNHATPKG
jgi:hypothetical protein